jgi:hypothetical protein
MQTDDWVVRDDETKKRIKANLFIEVKSVRARLWVWVWPR